MELCGQAPASLEVEVEVPIAKEPSPPCPSILGEDSGNSRDKSLTERENPGLNTTQRGDQPNESLTERESSSSDSMPMEEQSDNRQDIHGPSESLTKR